LPTIRIPTPLARFAGDQKTVRVDGSTVDEALESLVQQHEALRQHLFDDNGQLRNFVNVYLGDTDIRSLEKGATPVKQDDQLVIVPSIAGGAPGSAATQTLSCRGPN
jgi:molybdopterin converting factor small subunit